MATEWQIALAVLCGFLIGALCTWVACCIAGKSEPPGRDDPGVVGADADGRATGAPQGRPER